MTPDSAMDRRLARLQLAAALCAAVGLGVCAVGFVYSRRQFFQSWLIGWLFWLGIALGCFALGMLHHLIKGNFRLITQRFFEAGSRTFLTLFVLSLPLIFGVRRLYPWAHESAMSDPDLKSKEAYLNLPFFFTRAGIYFAAWLLLSLFVNVTSHRLEKNRGIDYAHGVRRLCAFGLVLLGLTITFAAIDWIMSLEPHWNSSIFGLMVGVGWILSAFIFVVALVCNFSGDEPLATAATPPLINDLGNLLLTFLMLWAYMSFSQYMLIYSANLPEEVTWYLERLRHGWQFFALVIVLLHFVVPFGMLLSRGNKRNPRRLGWIAGGLFIMRIIDHYWLIAPAFRPVGPHIHWLNFAAFFGIGGVWLLVFVWQLKRWPLLLPQEETSDVFESVGERSHAG